MLIFLWNQWYQSYTPHSLLHLLGLTLCSDGQSHTEGSHCILPDSELGVPYGMEDNIQELLHLLEEVGRHRQGQFSQHQYLRESTKTQY